MNSNIMIIFMKIAVMIFTALLGLSSFVHTQGLPSLTIAGFVNQGSSEDDHMNVMATLYLTSFISKLSPGVTPYTDVEREAQAGGFWKRKILAVDRALAIARKFNSVICVTGDYSVDDLTRKFRIRMQAIDVETRQVRFEKYYRGDAGQEMFPTLDRMVRDLIIALFKGTVEMSGLKVVVEQPGGRYQFSINGNVITEIEPGRGYENEFVVGQFVNVVLRRPDTGREVLNTNVLIGAGKPVLLRYRPSGTAVVRTGSPGLEVVWNEKPAGMTGSDGNLAVANVAAWQTNTVSVRHADGQTVMQSVIVGEAETVTVPLLPDRRFLMFAINTGAFGWLSDLCFGAELDFYLSKQWRIFLGGGFIPYRDPAAGAGIIPYARIGTGMVLFQSGFFRAGIGMAGTAFFVKNVSLNPEIRAEFEFWNLTVSAGVRHSFEPEGGGFYPVMSAGFRF